MSADNILLIGIHERRVYVVDANFSDVSSWDDWNRFHESESGSNTHRNAAKRIIKEAMQVYGSVWKSDTIQDGKPENRTDKAQGFCNRYERQHIVEYGSVNLLD